MPASLTLTLSPTLERALVYIAVAVATLVAFVNWRRGDTRTFREPLIAFFGIWFIQGGLFATTTAPDLIPTPLVRGLSFAATILLAWGFLAASMPPQLGLGLLGGGLTLTAALSAFSLSAARMTEAEPAWIGIAWSIGTLTLSATSVLVISLRRSLDRNSATVAAFGALALAAALEVFSLQDLAGVCRVVAFWLLPLGLYQRALAELRATRETLREFSRVALTQTQELVTLLETSAFLFTSLDIDELLSKVIEQAAAGIEFDRAIIALTDPTAPQTMQVTCTYPRGFLAAEASFLIQSQPAVAAAVSRGEQSALGRRGYGASPLARLLSLDAPSEVLIQPLSTQDDTIGVFIIANLRDQRQFDDRHKRLLEALGAQIAAAVSSARMYHSLDTQARELARVLALRENELGRHAAILEAIADGIVVTDDFNHVIAANAAAIHILDTPRDQIVGRPFGLIFERMTPIGNAPKGGAAGEPAEADTVRATFQYGSRVIQTTIIHVSAAPGVRVGQVAVFRDITREYAAEQGRIQFVGNIARELRTPLGTIKGYADLLAKGAGGALPSTAVGFVDTIRANSDRLNAQVNAILQFHELDRGLVELNIVEIDVASILAEVENEHRSRLAARNLSLELRPAPNLPTVRADRERVRQVIDQLIDNARKFTPEGGRIRLSAAPAWNGLSTERPAHVAISIEDNGLGFDPHDGERLFEQFYHSDDPAQVDRVGLGIGLSIARGLCEVMGGHLWATGARGRGAKFTFLLPVVRVGEALSADAQVEDSSIESWIERTLTFPEDKEQT